MSTTIILLHGVGDTIDGHLLRTTRASLQTACPQLRFDSHHSIVPLTTKDDSGNTEHFLAPYCDGSLDGQLVTLVEANWADFTRSGVETHHFLLDCLGLVFGVRHIAIQAVNSPGFRTGVMRVLCRCATFLLQGPILALLILWLFHSLTYLLFIPTTWNQLKGDWKPCVASTAVGGLMTLGASVIIYRWRSTSLYSKVTSWCILIVGVITAAIGVLRVVGLCEWPFHDANGDWPAANTRIGVTLMYLFAGVGVLGMSALVLWASAFRSRNGAERISLKTSCLSLALMFAMWIILLQMPILLAQHTQDPGINGVGQEDTFLERHPGAYTVWFSDVCVVLLIASVFLSAIIVGHRRAAWLRRALKYIDAGVELPRLIVSQTMEYLLLGFLCAITLLAILNAAWFELRLASVPFGAVHCVYVLAIAAFCWWAHYFRHAIHIVYDVVIHFASPWNDSWCECAAPVFTFRKRIERRFNSIIRFCIDTGRSRDIVVIAHSQGTMIALEIMKEWTLKDLWPAVGSIRLVTMGSPFEHIYSHYFPLHYMNDEAVWEKVKSHLATWRNIYRPGDYVGMRVGCASENIALDVVSGDPHTSYWPDPMCFRKLI
jgi:hypothetical protein